LISFEFHFRNINRDALSGKIALFLAKSGNPTEILAEAKFQPDLGKSQILAKAVAKFRHNHKKYMVAHSDHKVNQQQLLLLNYFDENCTHYLTE